MTDWEAKINAAAGERTEKARAEIAKLTDADLADLICAELDRRRLDADGNPTDAPGEYEAATTAVCGLLRQRQGAEGDAMAERLAAVGRGVRVRSTTSDLAPLIREIGQLTEAVKHSRTVPDDERSTVLARTIAKRVGRPIDANQIAAALERETPHGRITGVVLAAGIMVGEWRAAFDAVKKAGKI